MAKLPNCSGSKALVTVLVAIAATVLPAAANADPAGSPAPGARRSERALDRAANRALDVAKDAVRQRDPKSGARHGGRELTSTLRDLSLYRTRLKGDDRKVADRLLARPSEGYDPNNEEFGWYQSGGFTESKTCGAKSCVHYLNAATYPSNPDAATSSFATNALNTAESVLATYASAGYRAPESDIGSSHNGDDAKLDIYLSELGGADLYGYCTSDDPKLNTANFDDLLAAGLDASAFCVIDNDYAGFGLTPLANTRVTLAHELFHATQFAYDYVLEDTWFMEATATWAEDELYDDINDNRAYLSVSPISAPAREMDYVGHDDGFEYGDWTFFRFLSERFPAGVGGLPVIIRSMWEQAADSADVGDRGSSAHASLYAVKQAVEDVSSHSFAYEFADFGARNRHPSSPSYGYEEGFSWQPYVAPPAKTYYLKPSARSGASSVTMSQLSNRTIRFTPSSLSGSWKVKIEVNLPITSRGSAATIQVYPKSGGVTVSRMSLNSSGDGSRTVSFSSAKRVELTITNASTRFDCWVGDPVRTCWGNARDAGLTSSFKATAYRG